MKSITNEELSRLCFCNSDKLQNMKVVVKGVPHEWVGIGWVALDDEPVTDDMYEIEEVVRTTKG